MELSNKLSKFINFYFAHNPIPELYDTELGRLSEENIEWLNKNYDLFEINRKYKKTPVELGKGKSSKTRYVRSPRFTEKYRNAIKTMRLTNGFLPSEEEVVTAMRKNQYKIADDRITTLEVKQWVSDHVKAKKAGKIQCNICK